MEVVKLRKISSKTLGEGNERNGHGKRSREVDGV